MRTIVKVQFKTIGGFGGKEYSYFANFPLKKGDKVIVPTREGDGLAQVSKVNVRDYEVASILHLMRTIPPQEPIVDAPADQISFEGMVDNK